MREREREREREVALHLIFYERGKPWVTALPISTSFLNSMIRDFLLYRDSSKKSTNVRSKNIQFLPLNAQNCCIDSCIVLLLDNPYPILSYPIL